MDEDGQGPPWQDRRRSVKAMAGRNRRQVGPAVARHQRRRVRHVRASSSTRGAKSRVACRSTRQM
eukprot:4286813-Pleurochrysis_carterae.AAC.1